MNAAPAVNAKGIRTLSCAATTGLPTTAFHNLFRDLRVEFGSVHVEQCLDLPAVAAAAIRTDFRVTGPTT